ncbi:MAG: hypothetical protein E7617_04020 [Ruminococcaceae bacterium]|nr:hypothetical protein [Oscillospiraceae bacterium]
MRKLLIILGFLCQLGFYAFMVISALIIDPEPSEGMSPAFAMMIYSLIFLIFFMLLYAIEAICAIREDASFSTVLRLIFLLISAVVFNFTAYYEGHAICVILSVIIFIVECKALADA